MLNLINEPNYLKTLSLSQLNELADELRMYLIQTVLETGGHLASGLGVVELTIALHHVFNAPYDHLIWDVGHQSYPHKILTGRRDQMHSIRQKNGLHPFTCLTESEFDVITTGHSSTSISAGLGLAIADKLQNSNAKTISIIGDGALTAGMAFEAMNHAGHIKPNLIVICNDNDMSISTNVGALNQHLVKILTSDAYSKLRAKSKQLIKHIDPIKTLLKNTEHHLKELISPSIYIEELGFSYHGPIDGHNIEQLVSTLNHVKNRTGPQFVHVITKKGKGFKPAEENPILWHGVSKKKQNCTENSPEQHKNAEVFSFSEIFGQWLCAKANEDKKLIAITPAMSEGSGMAHFSTQFSSQFFDVGIAEQHAITFAAGLAIGGLKPIVAIYSTFLQRGYDQLIHDVALQNLPVIFAIDRSGIVGEDGATHQGTFDLSFLCCIPNLVIMTPANGDDMIAMLNLAYSMNQPVAIRYPKNKTTLSNQSENERPKLAIAKSICLKKIQQQTSDSVAILSFGVDTQLLMNVAQKLDAELIDMRFVKPLDEDKLLYLAAQYQYIVTIEENVLSGGAGSAVNTFLVQHKYTGAILNIAIPDEFISHGNRDEILFDLGFSSDKILAKIHSFVRQ